MYEFHQYVNHQSLSYPKDLEIIKLQNEWFNNLATYKQIIFLYIKVKTSLSSEIIMCNSTVFSKFLSLLSLNLSRMYF